MRDLGIEKGSIAAHQISQKIAFSLHHECCIMPHDVLRPNLAKKYTRYIFICVVPPNDILHI